MIFSTYNIIRKKEEEIFIENTLTGVEVSIDRELFGFVSNSCIPSTEEEKYLVGSLLEHGIVAETKEADKKRFQKWLQDEISNEEDLNITLALTYACNLSCGYCYLKHLRRSGQKIAAETVVEWIKGKLSQNSHKTLFLSFFGGEPLLEYGRIVLISENLGEYCRSMNIDFKFEITTNGTLLDRNRIESLVPMGLDSINVTLDGDKTTHDRNRPFKNGKGSYENIMFNLLCVSDNMDKPKINLIVNIRENSKKSIISLIKIISETGLKIKSIRFKPIVETGHKDGSAGCLFPPDFVPLHREIVEFARQSGLEVNDDHAIGPCGFFRENMFVIGADNEIYPCTPFLGNKDYSMGSILDGKNPAVCGKNNLKLPRKCYNCAYAPVCAGGCRYVSLLNTGNVENITCEKRYFKTLLSG